SLFFIMSGLHGLHVFLGLVAMVFLLGRMRGPAGDPGSCRCSRVSATTGTSSTSYGLVSTVVCSCSSRYPIVIRGLFGNRYVRSVAVLATVGLSGLLGLTAGAGAQTTTTTAPSMSSLNGAGATSSTGATTGSATGSTATATTATSPTAAATSTISASGGLGSRFGLSTVLACKRDIEAISFPGGANAGSPKGSNFHLCVGGQLRAYGNGHSAASSAILYHLPPPAVTPTGKKLFEQTCSSCHGREAEG